VLTTLTANETNSPDDIRIARVYHSNSDPSDLSLWCDLDLFYVTKLF